MMQGGCPYQQACPSLGAGDPTSPFHSQYKEDLTYPQSEQDKRKSSSVSSQQEGRRSHYPHVGSDQLSSSSTVAVAAHDSPLTVSPTPSPPLPVCVPGDVSRPPPPCSSAAGLASGFHGPQLRRHLQGGLALSLQVEATPHPTDLGHCHVTTSADLGSVDAWAAAGACPPPCR